MDTELNSVVALRQQIQKARIATGNRVAAIARGDDPAGTRQSETLQRHLTRLQELETELDGDLKTLVSDHPMYEALSGIVGVGPILASKLLAVVDITRCPYPSSLWKFAGMGVTDGKADRRVKGEKLSYCAFLKTTCALVGFSFRKATSSPYNVVYDEALCHYEKAHPDWDPMHQRAASRRKMVKMFLSHLWLVWRQLEGLPIVAPYAQAELGHQHYLTPEDFGWPVSRQEE